MRGRRGAHVVKVILIAVVACAVFGFVTKGLWNWLMPTLFGLRTISFLQAIGLVLLSKILLGGFRPPWAGKRARRRMEARMMERWMQMTPEERERFAAGMRGRWSCGWKPPAEPAPEQRP